MKIKSIKIAALFIALSAPLFISCSKVTGDLDDQLPALLVNIVNTNTTYTIGPYDGANICTVHLVFYSNSDWTQPWFELKSTTDSFLIPTFPIFSTYIMAYLDIDDNGTVDAGEPCTGYLDIDHPADLTKLDFLPLEWKSISLTIDDTRVY